MGWNYSVNIIEVKMTEIFANWLHHLKDLRAKAKIEIRIKRLSMGNFGDSKTVGGGIFELRLTEGKGYRVYFQNKNGRLVFLLCGGDKSTQREDIAKAREIAKLIEEE